MGDKDKEKNKAEETETKVKLKAKPEVEPKAVISEDGYDEDAAAGLADKDETKRWDKFNSDSNNDSGIDKSRYTDQEYLDIMDAKKAKRIDSDAINHVVDSQALHEMLMPDEMDYDPSTKEVMDIDIGKMNKAIDADSALSVDKKIQYKRALSVINQVKTSGHNLVRGKSGRYWIEDAKGGTGYMAVGIVEVVDLLTDYMGVPDPPKKFKPKPKAETPDPGQNNSGDPTITDEVDMTLDDMDKEAFDAIGWTAADDLRMNSLLIDGGTTLTAMGIKIAGLTGGLATLGISAVAGEVIGGVVSIAGGITSATMDYQADKMDANVTDMEAYKNLAFRVGLEAFEALTFTPASFMAKIGKGSRVFGMMKKSLAWAMTAGVVMQAPAWKATFDKIGTEESFGVQDYRNIMSLLQFTTSVGMGHASKYYSKKAYMKNKMKLAKLEGEGNMRLNKGKTTSVDVDGNGVATSLKTKGGKKNIEAKYKSQAEIDAEISRLRTEGKKGKLNPSKKNVSEAEIEATAISNITKQKGYDAAGVKKTAKIAEVEASYNAQVATTKKNFKTSVAASKDIPSLKKSVTADYKAELKSLKAKKNVGKNHAETVSKADKKAARTAASKEKYAEATKLRKKKRHDDIDKSTDKKVNQQQKTSEKHVSKQKDKNSAEFQKERDALKSKVDKQGKGIEKEFGGTTKNRADAKLSAKGDRKRDIDFKNNEQKGNRGDIQKKKRGVDKEIKKLEDLGDKITPKQTKSLDKLKTSSKDLDAQVKLSKKDGRGERLVAHHKEKGRVDKAVKDLESKVSLTPKQKTNLSKLKTKQDNINKSIASIKKSRATEVEATGAIAKMEDKVGAIVKKLSGKISTPVKRQYNKFKRTKTGKVITNLDKNTSVGRGVTTISKFAGEVGKGAASRVDAHVEAVTSRSTARGLVRSFDQSYAKDKETKKRREHANTWLREQGYDPAKVEALNDEQAFAYQKKLIADGDYVEVKGGKITGKGEKSQSKKGIVIKRKEKKKEKKELGGRLVRKAKGGIIFDTDPPTGVYNRGRQGYVPADTGSGKNIFDWISDGLAGIEKDRKARIRSHSISSLDSSIGKGDKSTAMRVFLSRKDDLTPEDVSAYIKKISEMPQGVADKEMSQHNIDMAKTSEDAFNTFVTEHKANNPAKVAEVATTTSTSTFLPPGVVIPQKPNSIEEQRVAAEEQKVADEELAKANADLAKNWTPSALTIGNIFSNKLTPKSIWSGATLTDEEQADLDGLSGFNMTGTTKYKEWATASGLDPKSAEAYKRWQGVKYNDADIDKVIADGAVKHDAYQKGMTDWLTKNGLENTSENRQRYVLNPNNDKDGYLGDLLNGNVAGGTPEVKSLIEHSNVDPKSGWQKGLESMGKWFKPSDFALLARGPETANFHYGITKGVAAHKSIPIVQGLLGYAERQHAAGLTPEMGTSDAYAAHSGKVSSFNRGLITKNANSLQNDGTIKQGQAQVLVAKDFNKAADKGKTSEYLAKIDAADKATKASDAAAYKENAQLTSQKFGRLMNATGRAGQAFHNSRLDDKINDKMTYYNDWNSRYVPRIDALRKSGTAEDEQKAKILENEFITSSGIKDPYNMRSDIYALRGKKINTDYTSDF